MQFYLRFFVSAKIFILVLSILGIQTSVAETYKVSGVVSGDVLNIRKAPSLESQTIGSIPLSGKGIKKLAPCENGWCKISYNGLTGWSSKKYLAREPSVNSSYRVRGVRSDDVLFIRRGSSAKSKKIGSIPSNGRGVKKLGPCKSNRCKISYRGINGWSSMKYLVADKLAKPSLEPSPKVSPKPTIASQKPAAIVPQRQVAHQKPPVTNQRPLNQVGKVTLTTTTIVSQNGIKSKPYQLQGKTYFIEARGTVNYKTDPKVTDNPGIYGVDACYLFSFIPSAIKVPPVAIKLLKNTGNIDVCANASYNPRHIYRSKPFASNNSYQFWIDNSVYRAIPSGRGFLTVNIYETSSQN